MLKSSKIKKIVHDFYLYLFNKNKIINNCKKKKKKIYILFKEFGTSWKYGEKYFQNCSRCIRAEGAVAFEQTKLETDKTERNESKFFELETFGKENLLFFSWLSMLVCVYVISVLNKKKIAPKKNESHKNVWKKRRVN